MIFYCNDAKWTIEEVEQSDEWMLGSTIYKKQKILLLKEQANIIKTLKHELAHVWLYEYGHNQSDEKRYTTEDLCEILASSNDFINEVVKHYKADKEV